jgi:hypothetical protein
MFNGVKAFLDFALEFIEGNPGNTKAKFAFPKLNLGGIGTTLKVDGK